MEDQVLTSSPPSDSHRRAPVDRSRRYPRIADPFPVHAAAGDPIVHGDGVGYYAYVRAPLIEHNFDSLTTINTRIPVLAISAWMGQANLNP